MGAKLEQMYEFVKKEGGVKAAMRLAMKTTVTSRNAASIPDSPDVIKKFREAIKEIVGKYPPG